MASNKLITEKDYLNELERVCRIIAYEKVDDGKDLVFCRKAIGTLLDELAKFRKMKADSRELRAQAAAKRKLKKKYGKE
jgi:hypothetical protein